MQRGKGSTQEARSSALRSRLPCPPCRPCPVCHPCPSCPPCHACPPVFPVIPVLHVLPVLTVVSALIGIPLTWVVLVALEIGGAMLFSQWGLDLNNVGSYIWPLTAAWLDPNTLQHQWMIVAAWG